ncbi:45753_t:CDS:2, partial [Gigaspora margarita]
VLVKSGESVKNLVIIGNIKPRKRGLEFQQGGQHNGILVKVLLHFISLHRGLLLQVMFGYFSSCPIAEVWVGKIAVVSNLPVLQ